MPATSGASTVATAPRDLIVWLFRGSGTLSILVFFALVDLYFLVNSPVHFGESFARTIERSAMIYLIMVLVFALIAMKSESFALQEMSVGKFFLIFGAVFFVGSIVIASIFAATGFQPPAIPSEASTNAVFFFIIFLIAFPEELIFRDGIPYMLSKARVPLNNAFSRQVLSAALFSVWHLAAYKGNLSALVFAFVAGLVFGFVRENGFRMDGTKRRTTTGRVVALGLHAVYNAAVFGVFCLTCSGGPSFLGGA